MRLITNYIIGLADMISPVEPDSNEALRRWLWANPGKDLSEFTL